MKEDIKKSLTEYKTDVRLEEGASICQDRSVITLSVESLPWLVQVLSAELKDPNIDHH